MSAAPLRLLAILEAHSVTGPARNLLEFCRLARTLEGPRVETVIATWRRPGRPAADEFLDAAAALGIEVEILGENSALDRRALPALRAMVERRRPDLVQTHAVKSHFLLRLSGLPRRIPWVAFHHGYTFPDLKMRAYNQLDRWSLRAPRRIVTVSRAFAGDLARRGAPADRIVVLHNAIDPDWLARAGISRAEARRQLEIPDAQPVILAAGRLSREKAFHHLLDAFARLPAGPLLFIAGDGPERAALERQIAQLGLTSSVRLAGQVRGMHACYAAADVAAISSVTEGSPNVLLEAMAARVPVVATAVGGIPEIAGDPETAWLVRPADARALAAALQAVLADPAEAQARAARAHAVIAERYTPQARVRRLAGLYAEILNAPRQQRAPV